MANENVGVEFEVAAGCDGGGPMPNRDSSEVPGAGLFWSLFAASLELVVLPKIDGAALPAGWAGAFVPKEKVDLDVSLLEAAVEAAVPLAAGAAEAAGALGAKKFGTEVDGVVEGVADDVED